MFLRISAKSYCWIMLPECNENGIDEQNVLKSSGQKKV